ncbi:uncharacterized protein LOC141686149 [Apium graveolens]|uniref:uncharacterized protein LOC141686149 n=1 Tax=Apium graveolens TaxID=4045 RepID=UPI003D799D40
MWSNKIEFFLGKIGVDYCLTNDSAPENFKRDFEKDNKTCRGILLHYMTAALYLIYSKSLKDKEIWDALKTKYGSDDFGTKKYECSRWLNFRMSNDKHVLQQVHEYEYLCADIIVEGMKICEIFQANYLLEKLSASWQTYVHAMKHKQNDFTLQELVSHIKIEEQNRIQTKETSLVHSSFTNTNNLVESKDAGRKRGPKDKDPNQLHGTKIKNKNFKGATRHICSNREMFEDYEKASDGECVFMGNSSIVSILGKRKVSIKLTSGKRLHYIINGDFVGKCFCNGGLLVLDILTDNKIVDVSAYIVEYITLWHARLGLVNVASVKRLKQLSLIPEFSNTSFDKCEAEVENKLHTKIKRLRSDRGGEYNGETLKKFGELMKIIHEVIAPYAPEQNGIAEQKNRTFKDMMNSMLISSGMPINMWGETILYTCYVLNRVPHKRSD